MKRPASAAPSSSGNAERLANVSARSSCAAQPATLSQLKISSMRDVQHWLAEQPIASCHSADMERLREAAAVLSRPKPRKEDVRDLQNDWQVAQQKDKKTIPSQSGTLIACCHCITTALVLIVVQMSLDCVDPL